MQNNTFTHTFTNEEIPQLEAYIKNQDSGETIQDYIFRTSIKSLLDDIKATRIDAITTAIVNSDLITQNAVLDALKLNPITLESVDNA